MRDPHNVLIRPVVSEKSYTLMDNNVYVFVAVSYTHLTLPTILRV